MFNSWIHRIKSTKPILKTQVKITLEIFFFKKTNVCDAQKTHFIFHKCPKFILNNKAVVKKKAVSGEQHLQRFVFRKYQTKAFWCLVRY